MSNYCEITQSGNFRIIDDCVFVNDDGMVNEEEFEKIFG